MFDRILVTWEGESEMVELVVTNADTKEKRFAFLLRAWMATENINTTEVTRRLNESGYKASINTVQRWVNGSYKRLPSGLTHFLAMISGLPKEYWEVDQEGEPVMTNSDGLKIRFTLK